MNVTETRRRRRYGGVPDVDVRHEDIASEGGWERHISRVHHQDVNATLASAAGWNVVRGIATAVPLTVTPIVASSALTTERYETWILHFSLLPWILAAQLGIQTGIVALAAGHGRTAHQLQAVSNRSTRVAALAVAAGAVVVGVAVEILGVIDVLGALVHAFNDDPVTYCTIVAGGLATAVAASQTSLLLAVGAPRYAAGASLAGAGVVLAALLAWRVVGRDDTPGVPGLALVAGGSLAFALSRRRVRDVVAHDGPVDDREARSVQRSLLAHMTAQAVWVLPGLLISGIDNFLVAEFEADALTPYSLGIVTATLGAGFVSALTVPLVGLVASHVSPDGVLDDALAPPLAWATKRITTAAALIAPAALAGLAGLFAVQHRSVPDETWLSIVLMCSGQSVRLMTAPLAAVAIALGRQRALFASPLAEGATNLAVSVGLGAAFGVIGVALGTFVGAIIALVVQTVAHRRSFDDTPFTRPLWRRAVVRPAAASIVVALALCATVVAT